MAYRSFGVILADIIQATKGRRIPLALHRALRYLFAKPERLSAQTCCEDPAARQQDEPTDKANVGRRMALKSRSQPKSGAHPGGNITGVTSFIFDLEPKRLGLLRELRPHATTTAALVNPNEPSMEIRVSDIQTAARSVGQEITILNASTIRDIDAAFARLAQMRADALLVAGDPFFFNRAAQLVVLAARHAIPSLYSRREFAAAGGLMSYGSTFNDIYRLVGVYAARILKGEKPGDLPIQLATKFELVINLSTARALGLEIPPSLLARADEVIE